jgi:hypothetical protein
VNASLVGLLHASSSSSVSSHLRYHESTYIYIMLSLGLASLSFNLPTPEAVVSRRGLLSASLAAAALPALPALAVSARTGMSSPFTGEYDDGMLLLDTTRSGEPAEPCEPRMCFDPSAMPTLSSARLPFSAPVALLSLAALVSCAANHPGCLRSVKVVGAKQGADGRRERFPTAYIKGTDQKEGQKSCSGTPELADVWSLTGKVSESGEEINIDFSPKGGPNRVTGVYDDFGGVEGIKFPVGCCPAVTHASLERRPRALGTHTCTDVLCSACVCVARSPTLLRMATSGPRSRMARQIAAPRR